MGNSGLNDPIVQSLALPFLAAAILAGLLRIAFGGRLGAGLAGAAIGIGFLLAYWQTLGWPDWPPRTSNQRIGYIVLFALVAGLVVDALRRRETAVRAATAAIPTALLAWHVWRQLANPSLEDGLAIGTIWLGGLLMFERLSAARNAPQTSSVMIIVAAVGTSVVALLGASASLSQLAAALAAATAGFLVWNWPVIRFEFGAAALYGAGIPLLMIVASLALYSSASPLALAVLFPIFFADTIVHRIPLAGRPLFAPIVLGAVCAVPALIAVAIAVFFRGGASGYASAPTGAWPIIL